MTQSCNFWRRLKNKKIHIIINEKRRYTRAYMKEKKADKRKQQGNNTKGKWEKERTSLAMGSHVYAGAERALGCHQFWLREQLLVIRSLSLRASIGLASAFRCVSVCVLLCPENNLAQSSSDDVRHRMHGALHGSIHAESVGRHNWTGAHVLCLRSAYTERDASGRVAGRWDIDERSASRPDALSTAHLTPTAVTVTTSGPGTKPAGEACMQPEKSNPPTAHTDTAIYILHLKVYTAVTMWPLNSLHACKSLSIVRVGLRAHRIASSIPHNLSCTSVL
jgi:hypothetical protein